MNKRISHRLDLFDSSIFREVFIKQQVLKNPIDLSVGIPEDKTHELIKQAGIDAINNNYTEYTPSNGLPELRHALTEKLYKQNSIQTTTSQISIVPGLTTGLLLVYMAILDPGDEIITIDPGYPPYDQLARALGAEVIAVPTLPSYQLDVPTIEASITDKTKAIVINSPNNPTGAVYPEKDLRKLAEIAKNNNVIIISDEIYEHFVYKGSHFSIGGIYPDTITMHGFSKQYAMTGWRLGYISGPVDIINAINELQQYAIFSSSSIAQHAALAALKTEESLIERYDIKRELVIKTLKKAGIDVQGGQGSYYIFFKAPNNLTDLEFSKILLDNGLILVPGRAFSNRQDYMRISYGADVARVKKGMNILSKVINMLK